MTSPDLQGVFRSLRLYHGSAAPKAAMDQLYSQFIRPGDLVFDIGAHVGDRVSSFRRLGARVVALEPQPLLMRALSHIHGRDKDVTLVPSAAGHTDGEVDLFINTRNPTVSTASDEFRKQAQDAAGWEGQIWDANIRVPMVTLDRLIDTFGCPRFIKIDVEGFEDHVLAGLSHPVPALSFEFTTIARDVTWRCLARLQTLADYRFNLALGETQHLLFSDAVASQTIAQSLASLPHDANSGDVYAVA